VLDAFVIRDPASSPTAASTGPPTGWRPAATASSCPAAPASRSLLAAADTGALFWAGSATETSPIAETVESAFLSGRRAAGEVVRFLDSPRP
jgi:hypothetical protein